MKCCKLLLSVDVSDHKPGLRVQSRCVLSSNDGMKSLIGLCLSEDATWSLGFWALQLLWHHGGPSHGAS